MSNLRHALRGELDRLRAGDRHRELPRATRPGEIDLVGNDVLGLAADPRVREAVQLALGQEGLGPRASRLLATTAEEHERLEDEAARWLGLGPGTALWFSSGWHANAAVLTTLAGAGDLVLSDARNHASIIEGARSSRARCVVYPHDDLEAIERLLEQEAPRARRTLVVTEGVFSMTGRSPRLRETAALCARHGVTLVVDEAHAVGLLGKEGQGALAGALAEDQTRLEAAVRILPCGKALGGHGALVAGPPPLREALVNLARPLLFSTALPAALAAGLRTSLRIVRKEPARRTRALAHGQRIAEALGLAAPEAAIVIVPMKSDAAAVEARDRLDAAGIRVAAIRPPTVPPGEACLRLVASASHTEDEIGRVIDALRSPGLESADAAAAAADVQDGSPAPQGLPGALVAGTDTDVGKTIVSAFLSRRFGQDADAHYFKPVQTGEQKDAPVVARLAPGTTIVASAVELPLAASPDQAAIDADMEIDCDGLLHALREQARTANAASPCVIELAGGLLVPIDAQTTNLDLVRTTPLPLVLVARSGLGTLNHTLLTARTLAFEGIAPSGLVLVGPRHEANEASLRRHWHRSTGQAMPPLLAVPHFPTLSPETCDQFWTTEEAATWWQELSRSTDLATRNGAR